MSVTNTTDAKRERVDRPRAKEGGNAGRLATETGEGHRVKQVRSAKRKVPSKEGKPEFCLTFAKIAM